MTTLPVRAPVSPSFAGFGRVIFFIVTFFEVIADAQRAGRGRAQALSVRGVVKVF